MDRQQTVLEIANWGEREQRLGDQAHKDGLNEQAATHYARAKCARDEHVLLHGIAECTDPVYCRSVQDLLISADLYELVRYGDFTPERC
jgi:hypothetical protein